MKKLGATGVCGGVEVVVAEKREGQREREKNRGSDLQAASALFCFPFSDVARRPASFLSLLFLPRFPPSPAMTTVRGHHVRDRRRRSAPEAKPARKPSASPTVRMKTGVRKASRRHRRFLTCRPSLTQFQSHSFSTRPPPPKK